MTCKVVTFIAVMLLSALALWSIGYAIGHFVARLNLEGKDQ